MDWFQNFPLSSILSILEKWIEFKIMDVFTNKKSNSYFCLLSVLKPRGVWCPFPFGSHEIYLVITQITHLAQYMYFKSYCYMYGTERASGSSKTALIMNCSILLIKREIQIISNLRIKQVFESVEFQVPQNFRKISNNFQTKFLKFFQNRKNYHLSI